jgi:hypothetical protein
MKKQCSIYHHYAHQSGFGMDARGVVTASPSVLNAYYAAHAGSIHYANAPLPFYDIIMNLFGRKEHSTVFHFAFQTITNYVPSSLLLKVILRLAVTPLPQLQ